MPDKPTTSILVVDDEEQLRRSLVRFFEFRGYAVIEADGGKKAFELVRSNPIAVVVSDIRMAGGDGIELLKQIQTCPIANRPPVILITGYSDVSEKEAVDLGAVRVFSKPFNMKEVLKLVQQILVRAAC